MLPSVTVMYKEEPKEWEREALAEAENRLVSYFVKQACLHIWSHLYD